MRAAAVAVFCCWLWSALTLHYRVALVDVGPVVRKPDEAAKRLQADILRHQQRSLHPKCPNVANACDLNVNRWRSVYTCSLRALYQELMQCACVIFNYVNTGFHFISRMIFRQIQSVRPLAFDELARELFRIHRVLLATKQSFIVIARFGEVCWTLSVINYAGSHLLRNRSIHSSHSRSRQLSLPLNSRRTV